MERYVKGILIKNNTELEKTAKIVTRRATKYHPEYKCYDIAVTFDIEASSFYINGYKKSCCYIQQYSVQGITYYTRTWDEYLDFMEELQMVYNRASVRIGVHNLAYEFQWIQHKHHWKEVFALHNRKVIYATTDSDENNNSITFFCTYVLTGKSLEDSANDLTWHNVEKATGDLDYLLVRNSETELTKAELHYCEMDVIVTAAIIEEKIKDSGNILKIPYTNTGYVRYYIRDLMKKTGEIINIQALKIRDLEEYKILRKCFQGGFTHANALNCGYTFINVASYDFTSSYSTVMMSEMYPMSNSIVVYPESTEEAFKYFEKFLAITYVEFEDLRSTKMIDHPLSSSHCEELECPVIDNGRIVSAKKAGCWITNIDLEIYKEFYTWNDIKFGKTLLYKKGYLPKAIILSILEFYEKKTTLKGVDGQEAEYQHKKGMLNASYGMIVQDPINEDAIYIDGEGWEDYLEKQPVDMPDLESLGINEMDIKLERYNTSKSRFTYYPWGVFVTAYARRNLFSGLLECGQDYIYSDTDSMKILNYETHIDYINNYNKEITEKLEKCLDFYKIPTERIRPKNVKGEEKPMGIWDFEGVYTRFKTLGAKRYLTEKNEKGKIILGLTVSGVNKKTGAEYLETFEDPFEAFNDGLVFPEEYSGRQVATYIDEETSGICTDYKGHEAIFHEWGSIHMEGSTYNLGMSKDYLKYIDSVQNCGKIEVII